MRDLLIARRALGDSFWVFPGQHGKSISDPNDTFEALARTCGVRVSAHDLRRTYTTVAESLDLSPYALKALINHTVGSGVTEGYIQITTERVRGPVQKVCDRLLELIGLTAPAAENVTRIG